MQNLSGTRRGTWWHGNRNLRRKGFKMLEVICNKAATCKIENCGMKKPHWHFGCNPCSFDESAKCVAVDSTPAAIRLKYKYIQFVEGTPKLKTRTFSCNNNNSGDLLGAVEWYPAWRQYCFFSYREPIFNSSCLCEISKFLKDLNEEHKRK